MHIFVKNGLPAFSRFIPIYNWFYPLYNTSPPNIVESPIEFFGKIIIENIESRALYFHIPFCSSICTFCSFVRKKIENKYEVDQYVDALIKEINIKASFSNVCGVPVNAIFFGGGTPSILNPSQIIRLGKAIKDNFDLNNLREFSFEMSPLHIHDGEKLNAMKDVGVTHVRFGVQTFNRFFRKCFGLSASLNHIYTAAEILPKIFPYVSFDMLYGMNGQTDDEFFDDLEKAVELDIPNMAFYPINNLITQLCLHKSFEAHGRYPTSGLTKFYMNVTLNQFMRANGYLPHNGHEYVKVSVNEIEKKPVVTNTYSFKYHEHVYGYKQQEVIGFGTNAISALNRYVITNTDSIAKYTTNLLQNNQWDFSVGEHETVADECRGMILHLPYHGTIDKSRIAWDKLDEAIVRSFNNLLHYGFIKESIKSYQLTEHGWHWYVNLIYYLCPSNEQRLIDGYISQCNKIHERNIEDCDNY